MDTIARIENFIVNASEGFFGEPTGREDLHVTIRIANDFYEFLVTYGDHPPTAEIDYMNGTIRSGMDHFFGLAYACAGVTGSESWSVETPMPLDFIALRGRFLKGFESFSGSSSDVNAALAALLGLTHLELVFLAQNFPSAMIGRINN